ncbi:hypothetical protein [Mesobacillus sp.]|uniref:hypothetical protein n=1 Tax=Mesobacillus sp. TaxID=2675271 RepID=UPI0039EF2843
MQSIKFKGGFVQSLNPETKRLAAKVGVIQNGVYQVKGSLDGRISGRHSIGSNLAKASSSISRLEQRLNDLHGFLNRSVDGYTTAENSVNKKAVSLIVSWNRAFGVEQCNRPLMPQRSKSKGEALDKKSSSIYDILKYFDAINQKMSLFDVALIGSQTAGVGTALAISRRLDIDYLEGRPSLWQRLKGGYKFSVSADASWTSKGRYSSKTAKFIYDFSKSTPSSLIAKHLHKFVTSYTSPASLLKHAAGFPKNATVMKASTLTKAFEKRITLGAKEVARTVAEAKGFTKVGKRIPLVGSLISVAAGVGEYVNPENAGKTRVERIGRAGASVIGDFGAIAVGAKAGAMIGSLGGPIGVVVGGAVGGFVGGVASTMFGDEIKDLGEKGANGAVNLYKSVKSWFK